MEWGTSTKRLWGLWRRGSFLQGEAYCLELTGYFFFDRNSYREKTEEKRRDVGISRRNNTTRSGGRGSVRKKIKFDYMKEISSLNQKKGKRGGFSRVG